MRDLDAAMAEPGKKGVRFHRVARDGPVRLAFFGDQDGNALYLAEVAGSEGAER